MNVLFLTMNVFTDIEMHNIYSDLMKVFIEEGHRPYIVTPRERKTGEKTELLNFDQYSLLKVRIGNTSGVSLIEKGISTVTLSSLYYKTIKKKLSGISFGLILYSTPPITLANIVKRLKKQYNCKTYLMLKDIFPQNAIDLRMLSEGGIIHKYFRTLEKNLYKVSDRIGCMSRKNVEYILKHNREIQSEKVEICPNGIIPHKKIKKDPFRKEICQKYNIPHNAIIYLYGGNLGKPQGIQHLVECLNDNINKDDRYFIICGSGSEYPVIQKFIDERNPNNIKLIKHLPKEEYDILAAGCDVGLIFLDKRFTIPNYPSRLLTYMENEMPVIVCSDMNTDVGEDAEINDYGFYCYADSPKRFTECVDRMTVSDIKTMGNNAREFLKNNFTARQCYEIIMR